MASAARTTRIRTSAEEGFTLIELLVVLVIIGALLSIAVPSYLGFKDRASQRAAQANVRSAVPAVEAYYSTHSSYTGMTDAELRLIDSGTRANVVSAGAMTYCLSATNGGFTYYKNGPDADITDTPCS